MTYFAPRNSPLQLNRCSHLSWKYLERLIVGVGWELEVGRSFLRGRLRYYRLLRRVVVQPHRLNPTTGGVGEVFSSSLESQHPAELKLRYKRAHYRRKAYRSSPRIERNKTSLPKERRRHTRIIEIMEMVSIDEP